MWGDQAADIVQGHGFGLCSRKGQGSWLLEAFLSLGRQRSSFSPQTKAKSSHSFLLWTSPKPQCQLELLGEHRTPTLPMPSLSACNILQQLSMLQHQRPTTHTPPCFLSKDYWCMLLPFPTQSPLSPSHIPPAPIHSHRTVSICCPGGHLGSGNLFTMAF